CVVAYVFQADDGIRDRNVTGVQTCALPISSGAESRFARTATVVMLPCSRTITGAQITCAASGMAVACPSSPARRGRCRAMASPQIGRAAGGGGGGNAGAGVDLRAAEGQPTS